MFKSTTITMPLIAGGLIAAGLWSCGKGPAKQKAPLIRPVRTIEVSSTGGGRARTFSGVTQAGTEARLSFKVAGTIKALKIKVGQKVKKGQLLAELDGSTIALQVQQAQASYAQARAQQRNAKAVYERTRKLYETNNATRAALDGARTSWESTRAAAAASGKQIQLARSRLVDCKLSAPVAGAVSAVKAEVNENVNPGQMVLSLASEGLPEVKVTVPEVFIGKVKARAVVRVSFDAIKGQTFKASVSEVGVASEAAGATYPVIVSLEAGSAQIRAGMAAEVTFTLGAAGAPARILVPPVAVSQDRGGKRYVFVAVKGAAGRATVKRRDVIVGDLSSEGLEVKRGLKEGELLITAGVSKIRAGLEVKLTGGKRR
jgi:membrane fusion protein, multidrug efflux system